MTKCHRCKQPKERSELVGINIFDVVTGSHIITRWYCRFCAGVLGLLPREQYPQATSEGDAL